MKRFLTSLAAGSVLAASALAQPPRYTVLDLGTLPGGNFSAANFISNSGVVAGVASLPDGTQHSMLWYLGLGLKMDIGKGPPGGPNSQAFGINDRGEAIVFSETAAEDPNNENFCGYGTGLKCQAFLWQSGLITPLPNLGGNNSTVANINNKGEGTGIAETGTRDAQCPSGPAVNGTGPQVLDYEAIVWGPGAADIRTLHPLPGDTVGMGFWINDNSQVVGTSGTCADSVLPPFALARHAVLWEKDGTPTDLGSLGGTANTAILGVGNIAFSVNNASQVVGSSPLPSDSGGASITNHAYLWNRGTGMQDLGTLPGDFQSAALAINDRGDVVGQSLDSMGNPRPFFWRNGAMSDLNTLTLGSPLFLLLPAALNAGGVIVGIGATAKGDIHGFAAFPATSAAAHEREPDPPLVLSNDTRALILKRLTAARAGTRMPLSKK